MSFWDEMGEHEDGYECPGKLRWDDMQAKATAERRGHPDRWKEYRRVKRRVTNGRANWYKKISVEVECSCVHCGKSMVRTAGSLTNSVKHHGGPVCKECKYRYRMPQCNQYVGGLDG